MKNQYMEELGKTIPAITGAIVGSLLEWDWQTIVWILTAIYIIVQVVCLILKTVAWWSDRKAKKEQG